MKTDAVFSRSRLSGSFNGLRKFTLIELLITVAVIAILIAILIPALQKGLAKGRSISCLSQLKQCMMLQVNYANDFNDVYVIIRPCTEIRWSSSMYFQQSMFYLKYLTKLQVMVCPESRYSGEISGYSSWDAAVKKFTHLGGRYLYGVENTHPGRYTAEKKLGIYLQMKTDSTLLLLNAMKMPTETPVIADTESPGKEGGMWMFCQEGGTYFIERHLGRGNMAFADGHCSSRTGWQMNKAPYNLKAWYSQFGTSCTGK